jgi:hypothetical protein
MFTVYYELNGVFERDMGFRTFGAAARQAGDILLEHEREAGGAVAILKGEHAPRWIRNHRTAGFEVVAWPLLFTRNTGDEPCATCLCAERLHDGRVPCNGWVRIVATRLALRRAVAA